MRSAAFQPNFEGWRSVARALLNEGVEPEEVLFQESNDPQLSLLLPAGQASFAKSAAKAEFLIPRPFLSLARCVSFHRDPERWALLYQALWRILHGEHDLLKISFDAGVARLEKMAREVRRDAHKMKAFVRFRKVDTPSGPHYVAWHRPDQLIVPMVAPFFARRFAGMSWSILTPDASAHWDGEKLEFGEGCPSVVYQQEIPSDALEDLWKSYYASIFNPARLKLKAMRSEMPVRHWKTLPEAELIPELIEQSGGRVRKMLKNVMGTAEPFLPVKRDLASLKAAAADCQGCPLYKKATRTVFGEGSTRVKLLLVGEQPGDQEDLAGKPFVGPAGKMLEKALGEAGLKRSEFYVTNAVKHFKWRPQGDKRIHEKPNGREITACKPWLKAELELVKPEVLVCLGSTAAQSVLGRKVTLKDERGRFFPTAFSDATYVTVHPSSLLRQPDHESREKAYREFLRDLKKIARKLGGS